MHFSWKSYQPIQQKFGTKQAQRHDIVSQALLALGSIILGHLSGQFFPWKVDPTGRD